MNSGIILITRCCGRGFAQVKHLIELLAKENIIYQFHSAKPRSCKDILEKYGISQETANQSPHFYVEDIVMPVERLNDAHFVDELINQLRKINYEKNRLEEQNKQTRQVPEENKGEIK